MRVLVCGGRDYGDWVRVQLVLDQLHRNKPITHIIEGGAKGADNLGQWWARTRKIPFTTYKALWDDLTQLDAVICTRANGTKYDAMAGPRRNQQMLDEGKPDLVVAFPGGTGTADMVVKAKAARVPVQAA